MSVRGVSVSAAVATLFSLLMMMSGEGGAGRGGVKAAPLFGATLLGPLLAGFNGVNNGTSALATLAQLHFQHKLDALAQLAEIFALTGNTTENLFIN